MQNIVFNITKNNVRESLVQLQLLINTKIHIYLRGVVWTTDLKHFSES